MEKPSKPLRPAQSIDKGAAGIAGAADGGLRPDDPLVLELGSQTGGPLSVSSHKNKEGPMSQRPFSDKLAAEVIATQLATIKRLEDRAEVSEARVTAAEAQNKQLQGLVNIVGAHEAEGRALLA